MAQQLLTNFTPPGSTSSYKFRAGGLFFGTSSGTNSAMNVSIPGVSEYYNGLTIILTIGDTITPASNCTLAINNLGAKSIKYGYNGDASHFASGATYLFVYDGTSFKGIHSENIDTTYQLMDLTKGKEGTDDTTGSLLTPYRLKQIINNFAPTKTGSGASGNWNINAATATEFSTDTNVTLTGDLTGSSSSPRGWNIAAKIKEGVVTNEHLAGDITNDKLENPSFSIQHGGVDYPISLGDVVSSTDLSSWLGLTNYSAGTGLVLNGTTFNHSNSITAKTSYAQNTTSTPGYGGTFKVFEPKYDAQGHITGVRTTTVTMPGVQNLPTAFTITANGSDDGVVLLSKSNGSNAVTYNVSHEKMFNSPDLFKNMYSSGNTTTSISGSGASATIKIPQIDVDEYGHVTSASDENITITMPTLPTALKNPKQLTVGSKTYDGSSAITITASDLGLANALHFIGSLTALPANTTGYVDGDVILVGDFEYVCSNKTWVKLGDDTSFAYKTITISAGTGLTGGGDLSNNRTLSLATVGTAGTYGPTANVTGNNNATIKVPQITVDAYGRITSVTERTYTSKNSNTTYDLAASTSSTNGNVKINLTAGGSGSGTDSVTIKGSGATSVTTDENGVIIVNSTNTTYSAGTGISFSGTTISNSGVRSIASGTANGTISVNTNGTSTDVAVQGLGSAAFTESSAYAASGHTHNYAGSSSAGGAATSANKVNSSLSIQLNGGTATIFDGSVGKTINITPASIGAAASSHGTHVSYSTTAPVMDGTASAGSASTVARSDHKHPTDTSRAAASALNDHTGNTTVHITSDERTDWNAAKTHADSAHAPTNAEKNQNAFSNVIVGTTTIAADKATDTLTFVAGDNITLTPDATNDKITIAAKDTIYTHPSHTAANSGFYKVTVNSLGHVTAVAAVSKSDITGLGVPGQDTTYGAEKGITLNDGKFGHSNTSITAGSVGTAQSPGHGGTFTIPSITYDAYGHITGATTVNITLPADSNTDTKVTQSRSTTSSWRPILSHATYKDYGVDPGSTTAAAYYHETMAIQPSTGTIRATTFKGALDGNAATATNVAWSGITSKPTYYDGKAITSITRSGTTFTATYLDGSTTTFTQQDNNTTYSVMTAATSSAAGKSGLVPAPAAGKQGQFLRGDGTWATPTNTTYSVMTGATSSAAGTSGLVPAPAAGNNTKFLCGNGTWATPTNTTYTFATGDSNGQIKVTPSGGTAVNISVKGLGSAAYTASTAYDAAGSANTALTNAKAYTDIKVAALVDSAPETLNTLNELAAALGDDPNFATTIATSIGTKANSSVTITAGNGLTGGGNLTTSRTIAVGAGAGISVTADAVALATSGVTKGSYGPSANVTGSSGATVNIPYITVDEYGRVTAASTKTYTTMTVDSAISASSTNPVQNKIIKEYVDSKAVDTSSFLPRSAGVDYPLTGPLGLTAGENYGSTLPTNGFNGQLFFLEDSGATLPMGGSAGQALVKNTATDGDASWKSSSISWVTGTSSGPQPKIFEVTGSAIPAASDSASGVVTTGTQTFAGSKTFSGTVTNTNKVVISYVQDVAVATANTGSLIIGNPNGQHIAFDDNEIMAKSGSGATASTLYLNNEGGAVQVGSGGLYGAVWNDYAEFRAQRETIEPGYCVASADNGKVYKTTEKFQACDGIVSDTAGFFIGKTNECLTPLAVAGRVLAYFHGNREDYHAGDTVCAGPEGKVMKMTREEIREWPDRIIGIVSEIPEYKTWGSGNVEVNRRIWIKVK